MYDDALSPIAGIAMIFCLSHGIFLPVSIVMSLCNGLLAWKLGYAKKQRWLAAAYPLLLPTAMVLLSMLIPWEPVVYVALILLSWLYCRKILTHPDPARILLYFPISTAISITVWLLYCGLFL